MIYRMRQGRQWPHGRSSKIMEKTKNGQFSDGSAVHKTTARRIYKTEPAQVTAVCIRCGSKRKMKLVCPTMYAQVSEYLLLFKCSVCKGKTEYKMSQIKREDLIKQLLG
jgi:hypothetical protein